MGSRHEIEVRLDGSRLKLSKLAARNLTFYRRRLAMAVINLVTESGVQNMLFADSNLRLRFDAEVGLMSLEYHLYDDLQSQKGAPAAPVSFRRGRQRNA